MTTEALGETIRRVLRDAPFAMRQLAADAGLSYDVLRSWRSGRRRPSRGSAQRLAEGLERRGEQLLALSRELRQAASDTGEQPRAAGSSETPTPQERPTPTEGGRPMPQGDRPATRGERPAPDGDRPAPDAERPAPDRHRPAVG